jgi:restriction endonuclease S subunit
MLIRLDQLSTITKGITRSRLEPKSAAKAGSFQVFQISSLNRLELGEATETLELDGNKTNEFVLRPGQVVISLIGNPIKASVVPEETANGVGGPNVAIITLNSKHARHPDDPYFLALVLRSAAFNTQTATMVSGTGIPHINLGTIREIKIPWPETAIRSRHVEVARTLQAYKDETITLLERQDRRFNDQIATLLGDRQ